MCNKRGGQPPLFFCRPASVRAGPISHLDHPIWNFLPTSSSPIWRQIFPKLDSRHMASLLVERPGHDRVARCFRPVLHMRIFFLKVGAGFPPHMLPKLCHFASLVAARPARDYISICSHMPCKVDIFNIICYNIKKRLIFAAYPPF